jgi:hypothetical protein
LQLDRQKRLESSISMLFSIINDYEASSAGAFFNVGYVTLCARKIHTKIFLSLKLLFKTPTDGSIKLHRNE